MLFLHIRKAGGTTICNMAKANNLPVPPEYDEEQRHTRGLPKYEGVAGKNCNPSPEHIRAAWTGSVEAQSHYAQSLNLDFFPSFERGRGGKKNHIAPKFNHV